MTEFFTIVVGVGLVIGALAVVALRVYLHRVQQRQYDHMVLRISIPQFDHGKESPDTRQQPFKEQMARVENFFSIMAGIRAQRGMRAFWRGRTDHFSLELVIEGGVISFYAAVPSYMLDLFIEQVHSVYPAAHLERVPDYNMFKPQGAIVGGLISFRRSFMFPLKTYAQFENDPLESLTTALSRVGDDAGAAIQFVLRSAPRRWHQAGRKVAGAIAKGASLKEALRSAESARTPLAMTVKAVSMLFSFFSSAVSPASPKKQNELPTPRPTMTQMEQEALKGIEQKNSKAAFEATIRVVVASTHKEQASAQLKNILDAFGQYNIYEYGNALKASAPRRTDALIQDFIYRHFDEHSNVILNAEEMVGMFHLPMNLKTPNIQWLKAKKIPAPTHVPTQGILLGTNVFRQHTTSIRIQDTDRRRHVYMIGQTGVGKSELMKQMAIQDIVRGAGVCVIDPHGDLIESIMGHIPPERDQDVVLFDPADTERPLALNMLEYDTPDQKTFVINEMITIFEKLYDLKATGGPMFEQYMRNAMMLIMDHPESGSTLLEIPKVLSDDRFRKYKLSMIKNPVVKDFWEKEAQKAGGDAALANMVPYITSKLTQFIANDIMRPIIAQQKSSFNFREVMDTQKILLINLSKGRLGDLNSMLLGMICVGKLLMAALGRADMPEATRKDFYLYIDEFQNYVSPSIAIILSEARKYKLDLTLAHQYLGQLVKNNDTSVRDAVFGNVGTTIAFRVGVEDAKVIAEQFAPEVSEFDVMNIEKFHAYVRLLVDNQSTHAFSLAPEPPKPGDPSRSAALRQASRTRYGRPRDIIEQEIIERTKITPVPAPPLPPIA